MEVTVKQESTTEWNYPCYGISKDGLIILFSKEGKGTVITTDGLWKVGYHADDWAMHLFTPFKGEIIIKQ